MPLPATVSPLEILWTAICLIGVFLATINVGDALSDLANLRASGRNGALLLTAVGECSDQEMILIALVCDLFVGVLAMFALPGREPDGDPSLSSYITPWLMIAGAGALIYLSFSKKRRRKKILEVLARDP